MTSNPIVDYKVMRDLGWMVKGAANWGAILGATGLAAATGSGIYSEMQRRKMKKLNDDRELAGAYNDTLARRNVAGLYEAAGYQAPHVPLAVSKRVSNRYNKMMSGEKSSAVLQKATSKIFGTQKRPGKFSAYPSSKRMKPGTKITTV